MSAPITKSAPTPPEFDRYPNWRTKSHRRHGDVWLLCAAVLFALLIVSLRVEESARQDREDLKRFESWREDWHRRCDRYAGTSTTDPVAAVCAAELETLLEYARRHRW